MSQDNVEERVRDLVARACITQALPPTDSSRVASIMINHGQFTREIPLLLASIRGQRDIFARLTTKVDELLRRCFLDPHDRTGWATEVPRGRAPSVREILNELLELRRPHIIPGKIQ